MKYGMTFIGQRRHIIDEEYGPREAKRGKPDKRPAEDEAMALCNRIVIPLEGLLSVGGSLPVCEVCLRIWGPT